MNRIKVYVLEWKEVNRIKVVLNTSKGIVKVCVSEREIRYEFLDSICSNGKKNIRRGIWVNMGKCLRNLTHDFVFLKSNIKIEIRRKL